MTDTSASTPQETMRFYQFVDSVDELIRDMFARREYIMGFRERCVLKMTLYMKLMFLRHLSVDQTTPGNPEEIIPRHLKAVQRIVTSVEGNEKAYMVPQDQNKTFPLWKAEVARKGLIPALKERLKFMGGFTIGTLIEMLGVSLDAAKKYAKQLRDNRIAVIKKWNNEEPYLTHLSLHPSVA